MREFTVIETPGREPPVRCLGCRQEILEAQCAYSIDRYEGAKLVATTIWKYQYSGYGHLACAEARMKELRAEIELKQRAAQGVRLSVWWQAGLIGQAHNAGHTDGESRFVPPNFPALSDQAIVYDRFHSPWNAIEIHFIDRAEAERIWAAAQHQQSGYEMHWFEPGEQEARHSWAGPRFGEAKAEALQREINAGNV
jgi:hypothetical protein